MTEDVMQAGWAAWAASGLPARVDVAATAKLPGDPAPNAPNWFAAVEAMRFAVGQRVAAQILQGDFNYWHQSASRYE